MLEKRRDSQIACDQSRKYTLELLILADRNRTVTAYLPYPYRVKVPLIRTQLLLPKRHKQNLMNTTSFLIVGAATTLGATAMFLVIQFGMSASDEYASKLSVTSDAYLKLRAKAIALGEDPTKIKDNAARSKRPSNYEESLAGGLTSPYLRPDSDKLLVNTPNENFDLAQIVKNDGEIRPGQGGGSNSNYSLDSDSIAAKEAGLTEEELAALIEFVKLNPTVLDSTSTDADAGGGDESENTAPIDVEQLSSENIYTIHDEIRHQLATEEMSDEKRAMMESLLPKKAPQPVRAVNVILKVDTRSCVVPRNSNSLIGVMFRHESEAIRGSSLNDLDELIAIRERCDGELILEDHAEAVSQVDIELRESRRDEVKYYLLQRRVPAESIVLSSL